MIQSDMFTFVRTQADADTVDAPDTNLTVYARMAYNDILSRRSAWPHLSVEYPLTTVAGTQDYAFTSIAPGDLDQIVSVTSTSNLGTRVVYVTPTDAVLYFGSPNAPQAIQASCYTIVGNSTLRLYPKPSSIQTYTISGFRDAAAWPAAAGSSPDLPRVFDEPICWFMLSRYYLSQEDQGLASQYLAEYDRSVSDLVRSETSKRYHSRPSVMGGNNRNYVPTFFDRVRGVLE